jgi:hypothetical protein
MKFSLTVNPGNNVIIPNFFTIQIPGILKDEDFSYHTQQTNILSSKTFLLLSRKTFVVFSAMVQSNLLVITVSLDFECIQTPSYLSGTTKINYHFKSSC